jgi:heme exporter protein D
MQWNSLADFLHMGGYAFFVWSAYAVTALCIVAEVIALRSRSRRALERSGLPREE